MKAFLAILMLLVTISAYGQNNTVGKLIIHKMIGGDWKKDTINQFDRTEIIHKMLIGNWVDSNSKSMGFVGARIVELKFYTDSIITTYKWKQSEHYSMVITDSNDAAWLKKYRSDTSLHTSKEKCRYKIMYVDWETSLAKIKGYCFFVDYDDTLDINTIDLRDLNEEDIVSISNKCLIIAGTWSGNSKVGVFKHKDDLR